MTETRRAPTEGEVKLLLRDTGRRMEDDAVIAEHASETGRIIPLRVSMLASGLVFVAGMGLLPFLDRSVPMSVWTAIAAALAAVAGQSIENARLWKVVTALARTAERARRDAPLPPAPSSPAPPVGHA
jgi:hypothetical protein